MTILKRSFIFLAIATFAYNPSVLADGWSFSVNLGDHKSKTRISYSNHGYYRHKDWRYKHDRRESYDDCRDERYDRGRRHHRQHVSPEQKAWKLLAQGCSEDAMKLFYRLMCHRPADGSIRIGYVIAAWESGCVDKAEAMMRYGFKRFPYAMKDCLNQISKIKLMKIRESYRKTCGPRDLDSWFMISAISYQLDDCHRAAHALRHLERAGDCSRSVRNLRWLIARG